MDLDRNYFYGAADRFFDALPTRVPGGDLNLSKHHIGVREIEPEIVKILEAEGVKVYKMTDAQREEFAKLGRSVHPKFRSIIGEELFDKVVKALAEYRKRAGNK